MAVMDSRLMLICGMIFLAVGLQQIGHYMDVHQHQDHFALLSIHVPKRSYKTEITFTSLPFANTSVHTLAEDTLTLEKYDFLDELKNDPLSPLGNVVGFWHIGGGAKFGPGAKLERDMVVRQQLDELKASRIFDKVRIHYRLPRALTYAAAPPRDDRQKGIKLQPAENQQMKQSTSSLLHDDTIKLLQNETSLVPLPKDLPAAFQPHLDRELFEFPTLYALWEHCHLHPDDKVFYIHSKSVTAERQKHQRVILNEYENAIMCLDEGKWSFAAVELRKSPWCHLSGNFWWSSCSHVINLNPPFDSSYLDEAEAMPVTGGDCCHSSPPTGRFMAEYWMMNDRLGPRPQRYFGNVQKNVDHCKLSPAGDISLMASSPASTCAALPMSFDPDQVLPPQSSSTTLGGRRRKRKS